MIKLLVALTFNFFCVISLVYGQLTGDQLTGSERILNYDSTIVIQNNLEIRVEEKIRVEAANKNINRGIYRDFPTKYKDKFGNNVNVDFNLVSVQKNGVDEPYHSENVSNGIRIYIGSSNVILRPGIYEYKLSYTLKYALGFFEKYDELYWNVTGNGWAFPIEKARAIVYLPSGATVVQHAAYTGYVGAVDKNYVVKIEENKFSAETTTVLQPTQGLTIAVAWPKGILKAPTEREQLLRWMHDNKTSILSLISLLLVLLYYAVTWFFVGRDPRKKTIIPQFEPPSGFSPGTTHYVMNMGFSGNNVAFTAAVINLAVKGFISIASTEKEFSAKKIKENFSSEDLPIEERAVLENLFKKNKSIIFKQSNHAKISAVINDFEKTIKKSTSTDYFVNNKGYFLFGLALTLVFMLGFILSSDATEELAFMTIWLSGWTLGVAALSIAVFSAWKGVLSGKSKKYGQAIFMTIFAIPFWIAEIVVLVVFANQISWMPILVLFLMFVINIVFYQLLKQPTLRGRIVMDHIEGFKLFLRVAEQDRLQALNPPDITPEMFEKYLPYALALGLENDWCEKFQNVVNQSNIENYNPRWYSGSMPYSALGATGFAAAIGSSFSSSISAASSAPGSSSGSSGGGSSGGGGGGGGGGGW